MTSSSSCSVSASPIISLLGGENPSSNQINRGGFTIAQISGFAVGGIVTCVACVAMFSFFRTKRKTPRSLHAKPSKFGERVIPEKGIVSSRAVKVQINETFTTRQSRIVTVSEGRQGTRS